ncbi:hypothetical protein CVT24_000789 [Panaeolus cyanescens]|uniref:MutL C-terminal dimerisation domain-containing protein n=1 Tax=Panaeolus cyanescens TaxID=181874 RepID=A0A409YCP5_9AGAR|nr:hypothetical protein CVT24_000789 [Panaeolus cyanescens]
MTTFGFRGEALSALCALSEQMTVCTATADTQPKAVLLEMDTHGRVKSRKTAARKQGTTVTITNLFSSLPVRRKEFERNVKREFGKALALLNAYALLPCASRSGIILTVTNQPDKGQKTVQIKTLGIPSTRASVVALWGPKATDNLIDMSLNFEVEREKMSLKRSKGQSAEPFSVEVQGLLSRFAPGCGRTGTDRQFFFVNGRPCNMPKIQKAFNEVYRSFNANQSPFILANFVLPTDCYDVNVSPDKRTILLHSEGNIISNLKETLESVFAPSRSTFDVGPSSSQAPPPKKQSLLTQTMTKATPTSIRSDSPVHEGDSPAKDISTISSGPLELSDDVEELARPGAHPAEEAIPEEEVNNITIDSSQTKWGNRLGLVSPRKSTSTSRQVSPEVEILPDTVHHESEPPRKKRKSEMGLPENAATNRRRETSALSHATRTEDTAKEANPSSRQTLKSRLRQFASTASGASQKAEEEAMDVDDDNLSLDMGHSPSSESHNDTSLTIDDDDQIDELLPGPSSPESNGLPSPFKPLAADESSDVDCHEKSEKSVEQDTSNQHQQSDDSEDDDPMSVLSQAKSTTSTNPPLKTPLRDGITRPEIIRSGGPEGDTVVAFDLVKTRQAYLRMRNHQSHLNGTQTTKDVHAEQTLEDASVSNTDNNSKAANALSRVIEKSDFASMDILGQFNLGFIVVRRRKAAMDDLFIVDQHAADEKYNFENLQATTRIQSQRLFRPQPLELTAGDEMLAIEGLDVIRQNGFEIEVDEGAPIGRGSRLKLVAQPTSKDTVFNMKDLEEIIELMRDRPSGQVVRCSKARSMFAMRACRKSVMIGMPLTYQQMTQVVRHMGTMDQPWNCPHGRPTMRHLADIRTAGSRQREAVDWASFQ